MGKEFSKMTEREIILDLAESIILDNLRKTKEQKEEYADKKKQVSEKKNYKN